MRGVGGWGEVSVKGGLGGIEREGGKWGGGELEQFRNRYQETKK